MQASDLYWSCPSGVRPADFRRSCLIVEMHATQIIRNDGHLRDAAIQCACGLLARKNSVNIYYNSLITSTLRTLEVAIEQAFDSPQLAQLYDDRYASARYNPALRALKLAPLFDRIRLLANEPYNQFRAAIIAQVLDYFQANYYNPKSGHFSEDSSATRRMLREECARLSRQISPTLRLLKTISHISQSDLSYFNLISLDADLLRLENLRNFCLVLASSNFHKSTQMDILRTEETN